MSKCSKKNFWKFLSAILSRVFFALHGFGMIATLVFVKENENYGYLLCIVALLFIEMIITLAVTEKGEWKWFSPMVFIYLCSVIPPIFLMELELIDDRQKELNITTDASDKDSENLIQTYSSILQILEQVLVIVLVIGRWLMPKGGLNREQLSQLLLIYLGLGADILDILQLVKEKSVHIHRNVAIVGLYLFCWTIIQFTFVFTQAEEDPRSQKTSVTEESLSLSDLKTQDMCRWFSSEVESFLITIGMHDGPFLAYRVYVVIVIGVVTDSIIFFICKNILTLIIETYRLVALQCKNRKERKQYEQDG